MPLSKSLSAYPDCQAALDRALYAPNGVKISVETKGKAVHLVQRMRNFIKMTRRKSLEIYPEGAPERGVTAYDPLEIVAKENAVFIKLRTAETLKVEEL